MMHFLIQPVQFPLWVYFLNCLSTAVIAFALFLVTRNQVRHYQHWQGVTQIGHQRLDHHHAVLKNLEKFAVQQGGLNAAWKSYVESDMRFKANLTGLPLMDLPGDDPNAH